MFALHVNICTHDDSCLTDLLPLALTCHIFRNPWALLPEHSYSQLLTCLTLWYDSCTVHSLVKVQRVQYLSYVCVYV